MPYSHRTPTLSEKLWLIPLVFQSLANGLFHLVYGKLRSRNDPHNALDDFAAGVCRLLFTHWWTPEQLLYLFDPDEEAYRKVAKKNGFDFQSTATSEGVKGYWFGSPKAKQILMYCHGGGYHTPAFPGMMEYTSRLQKDSTQDGHDFAVMMLEYTLSLVAPYPKQLEEATAMLRHLVEVEGRDPSTIFIGGDSAGANLTFSLLGHLLHPHPTVPKLTLSKPLAGAFTVSPWTSFERLDNRLTDTITNEASIRWSAMFVGQSKPDYYNEPNRADGQWWKDLDMVVKEVLIWGGGGEVLEKPIRDLAKKLQVLNNNVTLMMEPWAAHEAPISDCTVPGKPKSESAKALESWLMARL